MNLSTRYSFSPTGFGFISPSQIGVYYLFSGDELIYIGSSETSIRQRLLRHYTGVEGQCTRHATSWTYEATVSPRYFEEMRLNEFRLRNGRLPRCNDRRI